ncbi:MAG: hypothetical protein R2695_14440 [Acidimicrobiales bacterium]
MIYALAMVSPMNIGLRHVLPGLLLLLVPTAGLVGMRPAAFGARSRRRSSSPPSRACSCAAPPVVRQRRLGRCVGRARARRGLEPRLGAGPPSTGRRAAGATRGTVFLRNFGEYDASLYGLDVTMIDGATDPSTLRGWVVVSQTRWVLEGERWAPFGPPDERLAGSYVAWDRTGASGSGS